MKKMISLILCLALVLLCAAACAEGVAETFITTVRDRFELKGPLPEGYRYATAEQNDIMTRASITSEDPSQPELMLVIYFDEQYANVEKLNDLSTEQIELIKAGFLEENSVTFTDAETSLGTKLLIVRENGSDADFLDIFTIYRGHEIELQIRPGTEAANGALTDEQVKKCIDFLSDLEFNPLGA